MRRSVSVELGSEIVYVAGTVNGKAAIWTLSGPNRWSTAAERSTGDTYEIALTAYDAAGNRSDYAATLTYGLSFKFDWTKTDFLNAPDLNRLDRNVIALYDLLTLHGYALAVETKTDWTQRDIPLRSDIDRIRSNVNALQDAFFNMPDWREIVYNNTVDADQMNALEWDLYAISQWLERMAAAFFYSGELFSGEA